ncbi:hypothetical protein TNCV_2504211 [Trichonephila clavipes]|nr:hypothetical protein TNCV_2504211 [Trichonephila clavipes]
MGEVDGAKKAQGPHEILDPPRHMKTDKKMPPQTHRTGDDERGRDESTPNTGVVLLGGLVPRPSPETTHPSSYRAPHHLQQANGATLR